MLKKILLFFLSLFVGIGLLIWVVSFIGWQNIRSSFLIFAGWHGMIILLLTVLMLFFGMWKWKIILKSQGYNLSNSQLIAPYLSGFSMTYLFPIFILGGEVFKAALLKENYKVPWKNGITSIIIDKILEATSFLLIIFAGLIFFLIRISLPPQNLGIIFGVFLFFISIGMGFFYFKIFKKESIVKTLAKLFNRQRFLNGEILEAEKEIFVFFKSHKGALISASFLAFLRVAATWLRCWILILFLGKSIGILTALSITGFYYIAFMIPIPAAIGSHELIQTFSFTALGLGGGMALAFTMIQRGAELILALAGLAIFFKFGAGLLWTFLFRKIEKVIY